MVRCVVAQPTHRRGLVPHCSHGQNRSRSEMEVSDDQRVWPLMWVAFSLACAAVLVVGWGAGSDSVLEVWLKRESLPYVLASLGLHFRYRRMDSTFHTLLAPGAEHLNITDPSHSSKGCGSHGSADCAATYRRVSSIPGCEATAGPRDDPDFLNRVRPCGELSSICTDIPVAKANTDYPGGGAAGAVIPNQDYLVQFDIGLHPEVARQLLKRHLREIESCMNCPSFGEQCLEVVVTGGAMWGNLGVPNIHSGAYDCMGGCGKGCAHFQVQNRQDVGALDCLKHDLCSAWKSLQTRNGTQGFCHDPDCGDEAAMTIFNCWKGWRFFGSVGSNSNGPFSRPVVCDPSTRNSGCWSHGGWFTKGRCKIFQGLSKGQGIPDPSPFRSPIQRL
mmetsp:Transcript_53247/g.142484  ORF Transcript_53247/g.142484 Transcript_53247/m.142484 type:complete len:388 (-) Transcript_53247:118-1281(-)